jgi:hypothetical protein
MTQLVATATRQLGCECGGQMVCTARVRRPTEKPHPGSYLHTCSQCKAQCVVRGVWFPQKSEYKVDTQPLEGNNFVLEVPRSEA